MKLYKIIGPQGEPLNGGSGLWLLPTKDKPGKWMPKINDVVACSSGYHLVKTIGIVEWLPRASQTGALWEAEGCGASDSAGTKTAFAQARLLKRIGILDEVSMRLAAADMAERVLPVFYKVRPEDDRPAKAIQAARDYARGKIADAARNAAGNAAGNAARAATQFAAGAAARAAAGAAAQFAAGDAARAAAGAAAAAGDAARAAARGAAARAAAWDAAWDANAKIIIAQAAKRLKETA